MRGHDDLRRFLADAGEDLTEAELARSSLERRRRLRQVEEDLKNALSEVRWLQLHAAEQEGL